MRQEQHQDIAEEGNRITDMPEKAHEDTPTPPHKQASTASKAIMPGPSRAPVRGLALLALLAAATTTVRAVPKPPRTIDPKNPHAPRSLPEEAERTVAVVGGGLAGLSAALELSERGYNVTVFEASDVVGGRLHSRRETVLPDGTSFQIEHGFHGWFHQYFQFKDIRERLGIDGNFRPWGAVHYIFKDYLPEEIESRGPYPLNLLYVIAKSPNLQLDQAAKSTLALPDLMFYDFDTVWDKYDNITFREWATLRKVDEAFYDIVLQPALSVTVNERTTLSAAEMLTYMQIYFLASADADKREVTTTDYHTAVLGPWVEHIEAQGATVRTEAPVKRLVFTSEGGVRVEMEMKEEEEEASVFDFVVLATDLGATQTILAASSVEEDADEEEEPFAAAVAGLRRQGLEYVTGRVAQLPIAPEYKVFRAYFDQQLTGNSSVDILETPDFAPVNLVAQYHLLEEESAAWANKTGGSVIEFHLYTWAFGDTPDDKVWEIIRPTVCGSIYPDICAKNFKLLGYHVNSYHNFPSFQTGLYQIRPHTDFALMHGLRKLVLAGDWLQTDYPSALMERAVSTGREAANLILLQDGVRQAPLKVMSSKGPGIL